MKKDDAGLIVIVDDSEADISLIKRGLKKYGGIEKKMLSFYRAEDFLEYLLSLEEGKAPCPAVVLLDINLPGMSGHAVLRNMRARSAPQHIPVIMVTHSKAREDLEQALENGANGYLVKPAQRAEWDVFCDYIKRALRE